MNDERGERKRERDAGSGFWMKGKKDLREIRFTDDIYHDHDDDRDDTLFTPKLFPTTEKEARPAGDAGTRTNTADD